MKVSTRLAWFSAYFQESSQSPQRDWPVNARVTGRIPFDAGHGKSLSRELEQFLAEGPAPIVFT
jgi:hypothetical protein